MNKKVLALIALAIIAVGGGFLAFGGTDGDKTESKTTAKTETYPAIDACMILTEDKARQLLGGDVTRDEADTPEIAGDDVSVSECGYHQALPAGTKAVEWAQTSKHVGLMARGALTKAGVDLNKASFGKNLPADKQTVTGYGDSAFWLPTTGQLSILKGGTWYTLEYGATNPSARTLDDAKMFADGIANKL